LRQRRFVATGFFLAAIASGLPSETSAQLSQKAKPDAQKKAEDLVRAIGNRDLERVRKMLGSGIDLNVPDEYGVTPLVHAVNLPVLAMELIRRGADVNERPGNLIAPLNAAAESCQKDLVLFMLQHGAKVNWNGPSGDTPLILASGFCEDGKTVEVLLKAGADPNASDDVGYTPLIFAAEEGNVRATELLIAAGAKLDARNWQRETALDIALNHPFRTEDHDRIVDLLLKAQSK
jgi:ankyrin repeat protein